MWIRGQPRGQPAFLSASSPSTFRSVQRRLPNRDNALKVERTKAGFFGGRKAAVIAREEKRSNGVSMTTITGFPALVQRQLGTWEGTYRIQDAKSGVVLDTHACKLEIGIRGERYSQRNTYTWDDGREEVYEFAGRMIDGLFRIQSERIDGYTVPVGKDALCFYGKREDRDYQVYDVIMLLAEDRRTRTWSVIQGDVVTQIVQVEESRTSRDDAYFDVKTDPWAS